jgi:lipoyl-dependent peroxiredoxin
MNDKKTGIEKSASVRWQGDLSGRGTVTAGSHIFVDQPVSWPARTEQGHNTSTSPEELIAAAHASCFSMAFSATLAKQGFKPTSLDVSATVTFDRVDGQWSITTIVLDVEGNVPGIDETTFAKLASEAKVDCPVSRALSEKVQVSVEASLAPEQMAAAAGP